MLSGIEIIDIIGTVDVAVKFLEFYNYEKKVIAQVIEDRLLEDKDVEMRCGDSQVSGLSSSVLEDEVSCNSEDLSQPATSDLLPADSGLVVSISNVDIALDEIQSNAHDFCFLSSIDFLQIIFFLRVLRFIFSLTKNTF